jgi:hypothetical protein
MNKKHDNASTESTDHADANRPGTRHRKFLQLLPEWIETDPAWARYRAAKRMALYAIAWRCQRPDEVGSLLPCYVSKRLFAEIGCSPAAFWKWLAEFERNGHVVVISRGGWVAEDLRNHGNTLAIPGRKGVMDHLSVARRTSGKGGRGGAKPSRFDGIRDMEGGHATR